MFSKIPLLCSRFLLGRARFVDVCLFSLGELQYALDGLQVALRVLLVGQEVVNGALKELQRHLRVDMRAILLRL